MNDAERRPWVNTKEARGYKGGIRAYIRDHREEIDASIRAAQRQMLRERLEQTLGEVMRANESL